MIRVLRAEEALQNVTELAAGGGLIKKHEHQQIIRRWRQEARMESATKKTTLGDLLVPGIGLHVVSKKDAPKRIAQQKLDRAFKEADTDG